jgi:hypothetical protein
LEELLYENKESLIMAERCSNVTYEKPWLKDESCDKFIVRLYDGFDNLWFDVSEPLSLEEAMKVWREKTKDGTESYCYAQIDYYDVFPADTTMHLSA